MAIWLLTHEYLSACKVWGRAVSGHFQNYLNVTWTGSIKKYLKIFLRLTFQLLGYACDLRSSEILSIRENDITILDYFTQIFLVRRKNDQYRDGHVLGIDKSFKLTRPVKKLRSSCLCCQTLGGSCHPVVCRIFNSKIHISSGISNSIAYSSF